MVFNSILALEASSGTGTGMEGWLSIIMIVAFIAIFYFFMMRPQKKQEKQIQEMRDNLVVGDEITTIGGIIGKIVSIKEETCIIETGRDKNRIRILKSAVRRVDVPDEAARAIAAEKRAAEEAKAAEERAAKEAEMKAQRMAEAEKLGGKKGKKAPKDKASEAPAEDTVKPEGKIEE